MFWELAGSLNQHHTAQSLISWTQKHMQLLPHNA